MPCVLWIISTFSGGNMNYSQSHVHSGTFFLDQLLSGTFLPDFTQSSLTRIRTQPKGSSRGPLCCFLSPGVLPCQYQLSWPPLSTDLHLFNSVCLPCSEFFLLCAVALKLLPGSKFRQLWGLAPLFHSSQELGPVMPVVQCLKKNCFMYSVKFSSHYSIIAVIHDKCDVSAKISYYINCLKQSLLQGQQ